MAEREYLRLQDVLLMHRYYGTVSWQILAIFLAAALVIATLPFVTLSSLATTFRVANELFAFVLTLAGILFWKHNQDLADKWKNCWGPYRAMIDGVERGAVQQVFRPPIGLTLACVFFTVVIAYIIFVTIIIFFG